MDEYNAKLGKIEAMLDRLMHLQEEQAGEVNRRLTGIADEVHRLSRGHATQEAYSTSEFARLVERDVYTVREWCRLGRVRAAKRPCGRGNIPEWMISHEELMRYRREGLLPHLRPQ